MTSGSAYPSPCSRKRERSLSRTGRGKNPRPLWSIGGAATITIYASRRARHRQQFRHVARLQTCRRQRSRRAGRFGAFGGRYVPETLTRALDELAAEYEKARRDPAFQAELDDLLRNYVGRPSPLVSRPAAEPRVRRGANLSQARRPEPHRRPQDQQHARPGPAHPAHGQAPRDRRNRRRAARRRHRHGLRPLRPASASSTWARKTSAASSPTSSA